jgi:DNA-binding MarR family transcriptional regulator
MMTAQIGRLLKIASNRLSWELDQFAQQHGLTGTQMSFIDYLYRETQNGRTILQRDIEHEFRIQRSTTTQVLQAMEKKGLVRRQNATSDARQKEVHLTPAAKDQIQLVRHYMQQSDQTLTKSYSAAEVRLIAHFLHQIAHIDEE